MGDITIKALRKAGRKYELRDGAGGVFMLHPATVLSSRLEAGMAVEESEFRRIVQEGAYRLALDCAARLLSRRMHSASELRSKLRQRGYSAETAESVLSYMRSINALDDSRFAESYAEELKAKGLGGRRIRQAMSKRGIIPSESDRAISSQGKEGFLENARILAAKKMRSVKAGEDPRKRRDKLFRHLLSKGYEMDLVRRVVDEVLSPDPE